MEADATRWNERYEGRPLAEAAPPDVLVGADPAIAALVPSRGTALDVACGTGAQALWMAGRGFSVVAVDVAPVAIEMLLRAAERDGLADRIDARAVDLDGGLPADVDHLDLIVCQRFRDARLYDSIVRRLRPNGVAVVTVLSQTGAGDPGPFHAPPGELAAAFDRTDCEVVAHVEGGGEESVVARRT